MSSNAKVISTVSFSAGGRLKSCGAYGAGRSDGFNEAAARGPVRQKPSKQRIAAGRDDFDANDLADTIEAAFHLNGLEIGRLAGDLACVAAGFSISISSTRPIIVRLNACVAFEQRLQPQEPFRPSRLRRSGSASSAAGVPGRGEYLNENALANPFFDQIARSPPKSASVSPGKPTMKSEESAMSGRAARISAISAR